MDFDNILDIAIRNGLPQSDVLIINEYLEHSEWGIAFEQLCSAIEQENIVITKTDFQLIKDIGEFMGMDKGLWEHL